MDPNWMIITNNFKTHTEFEFPVVPGLLSPWVRLVNHLKETDSYIRIFFIHLKEEPQTETLKMGSSAGKWYKLPPSPCYSMYNRSTFYPDKVLTVNETIYNAVGNKHVISYTIRDNILVEYDVGKRENVPVLLTSPPDPSLSSEQ